MTPRSVGWTIAVFLTVAPSVTHAASITLDFDSVALAPGTCTDASAYLSSFGITFVSVSGGAAPSICNVTGSAVTPSSPPNVFVADPAVTNTDESYDLLFSTPLIDLSFIRAAVDPNTSLPAWSAFAFDAADTLLDSIVEPSIFPGPSAALFTLTGPGITRVRVNAFNSAARTFNHPPFDDMTLNVSAIPEPASLFLVGTGGVTAVWWRRRRSTARGVTRVP